MTTAQQLEYDVFLQNNPGDEHRASEALGFYTGPDGDDGDMPPDDEGRSPGDPYYGKPPGYSGAPWGYPDPSGRWEGDPNYNAPPSGGGTPPPSSGGTPRPGGLVEQYRRGGAPGPPGPAAPPPAGKIDRAP